MCNLQDAHGIASDSCCFRMVPGEEVVMERKAHVCRVPGSTNMLVLDIIPALGSAFCSSSPPSPGTEVLSLFEKQ